MALKPPSRIRPPTWPARLPRGRSTGAGSLDTYTPDFAIDVSKDRADAWKESGLEGTWTQTIGEGTVSLRREAALAAASDGGSLVCGTSRLVAGGVELARVTAVVCATDRRLICYRLGPRCVFGPKVELSPGNSPTQTTGYARSGFCTNCCSLAFVPDKMPRMSSRRRLEEAPLQLKCLVAAGLSSYGTRETLFHCRPADLQTVGRAAKS
jgi:hypothetical protein